MGKGWVRLNQSKAGAAVGEEVRGLGGRGCGVSYYSEIGDLGDFRAEE